MAEFLAWLTIALVLIGVGSPIIGLATVAVVVTYGEESYSWPRPSCGGWQPGTPAN